MSLGPVGGIFAGAAGAPLAQTKGTESDRVQQDTRAAQRQVEQAQRADDAAGVGQTDGEEHQSHERDADGRRHWEEPAHRQTATATPEEAPAPPHAVRDPSGISGNQLDLSG